MNFKIIDLFKNYINNLILVLIVFLLSLSTGCYYIYNIYEEEYIAKTTIMLGANNETIDIRFNQSVVKNYLELAKSNAVLERTKKNTELDYSIKELKQMISVSFEEDTEFITIEVTSKNELDSPKISYAVYESLVEEVARIFNIKNIHLVDTDESGYLKTSEEKILIITIFISFVVSFIANVINYIFFPRFNLNKIIKNSKIKMKEKKEIRKKIKEEKKKLEEEKKTKSSKQKRNVTKNKETTKTTKKTSKKN